MSGLSCFAIIAFLASSVSSIARENAGATTTPPGGDIPFDAALPPPDTTAPPVTVVPAPAATPTVPALPVLPDSEIAKPLVPLGQFDATPPVATAQEAAAEPTLRIRYTTQITGLKGVKTDAPEGDLEHQFRALSALIKDGRKAANAAQVRARADEDVQLAQRIMRAAGYYDGIATASVDLVPNTPGTVHVTLNATPGSRYTISHVAITQAPPEPTLYAADALGLKVGQPIDAALIEGAEANISLRLPQEGYPFVQIGQRDIALDDDSRSGDYLLPIIAGSKARFGAIETKPSTEFKDQGRGKGKDKLHGKHKGKSHANDPPKIETTIPPIFTVRHLDIFRRYKPGDVYDSRKVEDLRQALIATSLFSTITIEPVHTGTINPDGTEAVDLLVGEVKGPWHSLSGTAGYATGQGFTASGSYTWRNLFPPEGALILTAVGGTQEQGGSATFRRSDAGQRDRAFQVNLAIDRSSYSAYEANTANLSVSLSRASTPIWQKRWTWSVGGEIVGTNEQGAALTLGGTRPRRTYLIGAIPLQLGYDRSNDLLNPTKGFRLSVKLSPETSLQGGKVKPYARTLFQASVYYPVLPSLVIASRAQVGSIFGTQTDDLAPSRRLYSGGGGSVRGYGYQELGPKDASNDPIGGRDQVEFALEARYRFGSYGIVPFVDAGRVGESSTPSLSGLRYGAGIGGRYYTNFGPLRIDIATPIKRQPGEGKIALYIGIGQAF